MANGASPFDEDLAKSVIKQARVVQALAKCHGAYLSLLISIIRFPPAIILEWALNVVDERPSLLVFKTLIKCPAPAKTKAAIATCSKSHKGKKKKVQELPNVRSLSISWRHIWQTLWLPRRMQEWCVFRYCTMKRKQNLLKHCNEVVIM